MKLVTIPKEKYDQYRLDLMFDAYKWDPQFYDSNTIARHAIILTEEEDSELKVITEKLAEETKKAEELLNQNLKFAERLNLPRKIYKEIERMKSYDPKKHVRLMRFDFHPTMDQKWAISEVNSDVPGGFAESSIMPQIAMNYLQSNDYHFKNFGDILVNEISKKIKKNGRIMLIHCTSYSDDRQVMQFLGDKFKKLGYKVIYAAADHLRFKGKKAECILDGNEGEVDAIFRFTPIEWLIDIKPKYWDGYFDTTTLSCNHPIAIFAQTKRFPLVWNCLEEHGVELSTWRKFLPETIEVKDAKNMEEYIYKPAYGRVGEKISIKEACKDDEYDRIIADVKKHPEQYLAQRRFLSKPLISDEGEEFHACIGSYSVEGKHAGYYARISKTPRIDSFAADIPVLIENRKDVNIKC